MRLFKSKAEKVKAEIDKIIGRIASNDLSLVYLSKRGLGDDEAVRIAAALRVNSHVTKLYLDVNNIGDAGATSLAGMLSVNFTITVLTLGNNKIGHVGATAFGKALRTNSAITELYLDNNNIGDAGATSLAGMLSVNFTITVLTLGNNKIGHVGATAFGKALRTNSAITRLSLYDNNIDADLSTRIDKLVEINKNSTSSDEARRRKTELLGPPPATTAGASANLESRFYAKLMEEDDRNVNFKLSELIPLIEDAHDAVFFYTLLNFSYKSGGITAPDRSRYAFDGLCVASVTTSCTASIVLFKLLLEKASNDGALTAAAKFELDREAEVTHTSHAPFVQELRERIRSNAARIDGLEANAEALSRSVEKLRAGIRHQGRVQAAVGMAGAVLNAVSLGIMGPMLSAAVNATIGSIVDFGDVIHLQAVVAAVGDASVKEALDAGLALAEDDLADIKLQNAAAEKNPIVTIAYVAGVIESGGAPAAHRPSETKKRRAPLAKRLEFLEEQLQPKEVAPSMAGRVKCLEELMFGSAGEGTLLERVARLEEELGL